MANTGQHCHNILYVSNFKRSTSQLELRKLFSAFGAIISITIIPKSDIAFGFVQFDDIRDAIDAQKGLNKSFYRGRNLKVQYKNIKANQTLIHDRHIDTGDQSKSKEQILPQKPKEQKPQVSKIVKAKNNKIPQEHSRSRSRSRTKKQNHRYSRSSSRSCSRQRSHQISHSRTHIPSSHQISKQRKISNQIDKIYQIIDRLDYKIKVLSEDIRYKMGSPREHHFLYR